MTIQIAIVDPFVRLPAINCFNSLVNLLDLKATYHVPGALGVQSLVKEAPLTRAYIVLGSASHVHENLPWHRPLAEFLVSELKNNKPVLGCCFGHQLLCHAFGAEVLFHSSDEAKQTGLRQVTITEDSWNFKKDETFWLGVTHRQVVKNLPPALREIGRGLENDLVIHKTLPFLGTQAHPEASDHFCMSDIANLNEAQVSAIRGGGSALIQRFFKHFKLI